MKTIGTILDKALKSFGLEGKMRHYKAFEIWDEAVGEQIAKVATPYDIKGKTLFVKVRDAVWMRQLMFLEGALRDKLNSVSGGEVVNKIVFRVTDSGYGSYEKKGGHYGT